MSVFDFEAFRPKPEEPPAPVSPAKIVILALARDHRGLRAKMMAEALHKRYPQDYQSPLIKFYPDVGWRETIIKLRKASKKWDYAAPVAVFLDKKLIGDDDDFNLQIKEKHYLMVDPKKIQIFKDIPLLDQLQTDPQKTYVYFDVAIDYKPVGRMIFQIESDSLPKSTRGFLEQCCSQKFPLPEVNYRRSRFAGSLVRRIVKNGWIQVSTIDDVRVYARGKYEKPVLSHNRRGTLSLNVDKKGRLGSHIFIVLDQHPWMDTMYRAIGYLIDGEYTLHMIENVETSYERPKVDVIISDNGILYSPQLITNEGFLIPDMMDAEAKLKAMRDEYKGVLNEFVNVTSIWKDDFTAELRVETEKSQEKEERPDDDLETTPIFKEEIGEWFEEEIPTLLYEEIEVTGESAFELTISPSQTREISTGSKLSKKPQSRSDTRVTSALTVPSRQESLMEAKSSKITALAEKEVSGEIEGVFSEASEKGVEPEEEEVVPEEEDHWQIITEPDIQYTYIVPEPMVDFRVGYKKLDSEKYVQAYQKIGLRIPDAHDTVSIIPHDQVRKNAKFNYYELSKKAMEQATPQLLLRWAMAIDDSEEVQEIKRAISELLRSVTIDNIATELDVTGLDAISFENYPQRYKQCLLSLPTHLLQLLKDSLQEIKERQESEPLLVRGDSTSNTKLRERKLRTKAMSEDVISGCMLTLIEFTQRMIESWTELVPNMENYDFVMSIIDEVILKKVHRFIKRKKRMDKRFKKKLEYNKYHRPGDSSNSSLEDVRKSPHGISYWLNLEKGVSTPATPAPSHDSNQSH